MSLSTVYGKTGKGAQVLTGKSKALPRDSMRVLSHIDGKSNAGIILAALEDFSEQEFTQILTQLLDGGFVRIITDDAMKEFFADSGMASTIDVVEISIEEFLKTEASAHALDSEAKIRQQKEAEVRAKYHAEEQLKLQTVARAQVASERKLLEVADLLAKSVDKEDGAALAAQEARVKAGAAANAKKEAEREQAVARAKAEARAAAEQKAREEAAAKARAEAEEKARIAAEKKAREEAERKAREEAAAKARAEALAAAETKIREEAVLKTMAEAEAREEAVRKAREEVAARAEREAETRAREEAEALVKQETEEMARLAAEEKAQEEAERVARKQAEAEERAAAKQEEKRGAEGKARIVAEEKARKQEEREPIDINKWLRNALTVGRKLLISLSVTALVLLFLLQLVNLSMLVDPMEKLVSANINEPVTINKVYASLWPKPHLVLDGVTIGGMADIKIATIRVLPVLSTVFDDIKTLRYIELAGLTIGQDNLHRPVQWVSASNKQGKLKFDQIFLEKTSVTLRGLELPLFDGDIKLAPSGELLSATLNTGNRSTVIQIVPKNDALMVDMVANDWQPPIGAPVVFDELLATGVIEHNRLNFTQIKGRLYGGNLEAAMVVNWANQWTATGTFKLSEVELEELMPNFTREASLKGPLTSNATFTVQSNEFATMLDAPEINADFSVDGGDINGIDLVRAIRASNKNNAISGSTRFNKFTGKLLLKDGRYQYRQLALKAGKLGASGEVDILANQYLSGKIDVNLAMQSRQLQSHLNLSGKLSSPTLK